MISIAEEGEPPSSSVEERISHNDPVLVDLPASPRDLQHDVESNLRRRSPRACGFERREDARPDHGLNHGPDQGPDKGPDHGADHRGGDSFQSTPLASNMTTRANQPTPLISNRSRSGDATTPSNHHRGGSSKMDGTPKRGFMANCMRVPFSPPKQFAAFLSPKHQNQKRKSRNVNIAESGQKGRGVDDMSDRNANSSSSYRGPTHLHDICFQTSSADTILQAILSYPQSDRVANPNHSYSALSVEASVKDTKGKTPLHLLSRNQKLPNGLLRKSSVYDTSSGLFHQFDDTQMKSVLEFVTILLRANPAVSGGYIYSVLEKYVSLS